MSVEVRSSPAAGSGVLNPAANKAREAISADQLLQWVLEGYGYTASIPHSTGSLATGTSASTTVFQGALSSDNSGTKLIIPVATQVTIEAHNENEATMYVRLLQTRGVSDRAVFGTVSGTAMTIINGRSDNYGGQTAQALYTVTSSVMAATELVAVKEFTAYEGSTKTANTGLGGNSPWVDHLRSGMPIILHSGASLFLQIYCSGAGTCRFVFQWIELNAADYKP